MTQLLRLIPRNNGSYERASSWEDEAACAGKSHLFDILNLPENPEPGEVNDIKRQNLVNFALAGKVCASCPVFAECLNNGDEEDFVYMFRAGRIPTSFRRATTGRPRGRDGNTCLNGHTGQYRPRKRGDRTYQECMACSRASNEKSRRKAGVKPKVSILESHPQHNNWLIRSDGRKVCRDCVNERARLKYKAKKLESAKMEA